MLRSASEVESTESSNSGTNSGDGSAIINVVAVVSVFDTSSIGDSNLLISGIDANEGGLACAQKGDHEVAALKVGALCLISDVVDASVFSFNAGLSNDSVSSWVKDGGGGGNKCKGSEFHI